MRSKDNIISHNFNDLKLKNSDNLPKSNREYTKDNSKLTMKVVESWHECKSSNLNNRASLNPVIEDPSKEDIGSKDSDGGCKRTLSVNPFISNEELKTPTTIDFSIIKPASPTDNKKTELSVDIRSRRNEIKDDKSLLDKICSDITKSKNKMLEITRPTKPESQTLDIKESNGQVRSKCKLKAINTIAKKSQTPTKLKGEAHCVYCKDYPSSTCSII